jgi:hypothetical protein
MHVDTDLVIVASTVVALAGMGFSLVRRWLDRGSVSGSELRGVEDRLERIEQAIETMAVEVERVSEGQRFAARLLSERSDERVGAPRS